MPPLSSASMSMPRPPTAARRIAMSVRVTRSGWPRSFAAYTMVMSPVPQQPARPQAETRSLRLLWDT